MWAFNNIALKTKPSLIQSTPCASFVNKIRRKIILLTYSSTCSSKDELLLIDDVPEEQLEFAWGARVRRDYGKAGYRKRKEQNSKNEIGNKEDGNGEEWKLMNENLNNIHEDYDVVLKIEKLVK